MVLSLLKILLQLFSMAQILQRLRRKRVSKSDDNKNGEKKTIV
jgi:hypothetical protein